MSSSFYIGTANYNRSKLVTIFKKTTCDSCKIESDNVIYTDSSDGEYGGIRLCEKCILQFFNDFKNGKMKMTKRCKLCDDLFNIKENEEFCKECYDNYKEDNDEFDTLEECFSAMQIKNKFSFVLSQLKYKFQKEKRDMEIEDYKSTSW